MKLEFCEQCHRYHEHPVLCGINFMKASEVSTPTQQELNVRFAKALGWTEILEGNRGQLCGRNHPDNVWGRELPNYFAPENFHLVRAAVSELTAEHNFKFFDTLFPYLGFSGAGSGVYFVANAVFLSPVEHIITAYLKVKEAN